MSFILDALKKSEAERARKAGPALLDLRIASPRRRLPVWVFVLVAILLVNLAVLAAVLWRSGGRDAPPVASAPVAPAVPAATPAPVNALPPPTLPPATVTTAPPEAAVARAPSYTDAPRPPPAPPAEIGRRIAPAAATAPARDAVDTAGLPTAEDLRVSGVSLPQLNVALHVYDAVPANRYLLMNSQRLREGEVNADGVTIEHITPEGAVLRWRERRFVLTPGD